ncbi:MAG: hypothetical protein H6502_04020 [Candidatus Woesearchaeota archaeon]|nr:MAG: hypothetical protein H6502_04020 [Candidatus Woesearchaeota archaeon]
MDAFEVFCARFGGLAAQDKKKIFRKLGKIYLKTAVIAIKEASREGLFLGEVKKDEFKPSLALLSILAKNETNFVIIEELAEEKFLQGRNLPKQRILDSHAREEVFLVNNVRGENLGLGSMQDINGEYKLKNLLDLGLYLRDEDKKKSRKPNKKQ